MAIERERSLREASRPRMPEPLAEVIPFPNPRLAAMMRHPSWPRKPGPSLTLVGGTAARLVALESR